MSGVFGFATSAGAPSPERILARMAAAMPARWAPVASSWTSPRAQAGLATCRRVRGPIPDGLAIDSEESTVCVYEGLVHGTNLASTSSTAEYLLKGYLQSGPECVTDLGGSFNVVWWNDKTGRLDVANDRLGYRLLHYAETSGTLVFGSQLPRLVASGVFRPAIDPLSLADLLCLQLLPGDRTILDGVRLLPPGSILTFQRGCLQLRRYWRLDSIEIQGKYDSRRLAELDSTLRGAVRRAASGAQDLSVALTGGFDSRCIAAACAAEDIPFTAITNGSEESTDVCIARDVADALDRPHVRIPVVADEFAEWLEPMVIFSGGLFPTLDMSSLFHMFQPGPFDRVLSGMVGEFARCYFPKPGDFRTPDQATLNRRIREKAVSGTAKKLDPATLAQTPFQKVLAAAPAEHLREAVDQYSWQESLLDKADYFFVEQRGRKTLNKGPMLADVGIENDQPYLDREWVEAIFAIPPSERIRNRIQLDLTLLHAPKLRRVRFDKPLPHTTVWAEYAAKRKARLKRRLGRYRRNVSAIDPLQWSRGPLRPTLCAILYDDEAAFREYLLWDRVRPLLDRHFGGQENWLDLVSALTVFEISHRLWIQGMPSVAGSAGGHVRSSAHGGTPGASL